MKHIKREFSAVFAVSVSLSMGALFPVNANAAFTAAEVLPKWMPLDFLSAMDFRNEYGTTHYDDGIICIVERVADDKQLYYDVSTKASDGFSHNYDIKCDAQKMVYKFAPPQEPDKSDVEAYNQYEYVKRILEIYPEIAEHGTGYHYEALFIDSNVQDRINGLANINLSVDVKVGIIDSGSDISPDNTYTYSFYTDGKVSRETDIYGWLPDCETEFDKYIADNGNISYNDGMLIFGDRVNYSTGASLNVESSGEGKVKSCPVGYITKEYLVEPTGRSLCVLNVYEGEKVGNVDITFTSGRRWDPEGDDHKGVTAKIHVNEDMTISEQKAAKPVPEWIPQTQEAVLDFANEHGNTWVQDGIICFVRSIRTNRQEDYTYEYEGSAAEKLKDYEVYHDMIPMEANRYEIHPGYEVFAYDIPEGSDIKVSYCLDKDNKVVENTYCFANDSTGYILQSDKCAWLPDCDEEFDAYYAKNGEFSIQAGYVMYCTTLPIGGGYYLEFRQDGNGRFILDHEERITTKTSEPLDGGTEKIIRLYKPVRSGDATLTLYKNKSNKRNEIPENADIKSFHIDEDMRITELNGTEMRMVSKGDCNGDGIIGIADAVTLQNWLHGKKVSFSGYGSPDVNGDGTVDVFDLIALKKKVVSSLSEAPRPVMIILSENYAWSAQQNVEVYDQYGNCYNYRFTVYSGSYSYASENGLIIDMRSENWYDMVEKIMENASDGTVVERNIEEKEISYSKIMGALPESAVEEINEFSSDIEEFSEANMSMRGLGCDMGATVVYMVNSKNNGKPSYLRLSEYGDFVGWLENDECKDFVKLLASYNIYGSKVADYMESKDIY